MLERAGLAVGRRTRHTGFGTANSCFFFKNAMLELIWIAEESEARSTAIQPLGLWERSRWRETGTNPFGASVRVTADEEWPFPNWPLDVEFLPVDAPLAMASNSGVVMEPLLFGLPCRHAPADLDVSHSLQDKVVTAVEITVRDLAPASILQDLAIGEVRFAGGDENLMRISIEAGAQGQELDCRPDLPIVMSW